MLWFRNRVCIGERVFKSWWQRPDLLKIRCAKMIVVSICFIHVLCLLLSYYILIRCLSKFYQFYFSKKFYKMLIQWWSRFFFFHLAPFNYVSRGWEKKAYEVSAKHNLLLLQETYLHAIFLFLYGLILLSKSFSNHKIMTVINVCLQYLKTCVLLLLLESKIVNPWHSKVLG